MARVETRSNYIIVDTVLLGVVGAAAAWLFNAALAVTSRVFLTGLAGYTAPTLPSEGGATEHIGRFGLWLVPVAAALGGLLAGVITEWLAPEAEGHGTDSVIRSFHRFAGKLRGRLAPVKLAASAITIGSGGSAGREGPIAMVAAAVASWYADRMGRDEEDRRLLLLVGAAAGISAIFRSPIGAALFVVEVLYADMEFEARALLYATLGAIVAYALGGVTGGYGVLFSVPLPIAPLARQIDYVWYVPVGIAAGLLATVVPVMFYRTRDLFRVLRMPRVLKPALGGLLTGLIAMALPQLIGGGYGWMQYAIDGKLALSLLLALTIGKIIAMSLTVGSGGSGGVFAPSLYIGAMLGGAAAAIAHEPSAPFVIVGMAAVFAGSAHVPFAAMMMVVEMTGGYTLLVPAAVAVSLSYLVQARLARHLPYSSIYEAQVGSRGESPAHHNAHLEIALRILREQKLTNLSHLGELDLVSLLRAGVPVELGDGQRMLVAVLRNNSSFVNTTIAQSGRALGGEGTNVIAILRGEHMLAPRPDLVLQAADRVILIVPDEALAHLHAHFASW